MAPLKTYQTFLNSYFFLIWDQFGIETQIEILSKLNLNFTDWFCPKKQNFFDKLKHYRSILRIKNIELQKNLERQKYLKHPSDIKKLEFCEFRIFF